MYYGKSIQEWADELGRPDTTVRREFDRGWCKWPRRWRSGNTSDPAYKCWENMVQRATNPKTTKAHNYCLRGIGIWPAWRHNFELFIQYIGPRPSLKHSIDRIDVNLGYVPGNVRWATSTEQCSNRRVKAPTRYFKHGRRWRVYYSDVTHSFATEAEAARFMEIIRDTLRS